MQVVYLFNLENREKNMKLKQKFPPASASICKEESLLPTQALNTSSRGET